jgi:hypothetical protein
MMADFPELEALAEQDLDLTLAEVLTVRARQYRDVIPEEILDLLEEAVEIYEILAPTLSRHLRNSAQKEINFFIWLYQEQVRKFRPKENPQPPQKILQLLAYCSSYETNC